MSNIDFSNFLPCPLYLFTYVNNLCTQYSCSIHRDAAVKLSFNMKVITMTIFVELEKKTNCIKFFFTLKGFLQAILLIPAQSRDVCWYTSMYWCESFLFIYIMNYIWLGLYHKTFKKVCCQRKKLWHRLK